jgi:5-methylcytosine-specific restriction endonuclease McrA
MVTLTTDAPDQATVDHVVPKSKGGSDNFDNLQLLCRKCNNDKGDTILLDDGEVAEDDMPLESNSSAG